MTRPRQPLRPDPQGDVQDEPFNIRRTTGLQGRPVKNVSPSKGQVLTWDGQQWVPANDDDTLTSSITNEVLFVDSVSSSGTLSSTTLVSGVTYTVIVEGTYTQSNHALDVGTPESDAMFPGSTAGRVSTQVGFDADTTFAYYSGAGSGAIGHNTNFKISLDGGSTYSHREPSGGPYSTPVSGHLYRYTVTGQGHVIGFLIQDTVYTDNYGKLKVTIQIPNGTGSGSGAGSLVPPGGADYQVLESLSGVPTWANIDGGSA